MALDTVDALPIFSRPSFDHVLEAELLQQQPQRDLQGDAFHVERHGRRHRLPGLVQGDRVDVDREFRVSLGPVVAALMYLSTSSRGVSLANDIETGSSSLARMRRFRSSPPVGPVKGHKPALRVRRAVEPGTQMVEGDRSEHFRPIRALS